MKIKTILFFFILSFGTFKALAVEATAYVVKIEPHPTRQNALQIFLDENSDSLWEKRLDLFGESVQQILKDNIKESGAVVYETEGLRVNYFTSSRILAIILPNGSKIGVLDLFPYLNDTALRFSFPYAFTKRGPE